MYIKALLDLKGIKDEQNLGLILHSTLVLPAEGIFKYLEGIEKVLADFEWTLGRG